MWALCWPAWSSDGLCILSRPQRSRFLSPSRELCQRTVASVILSAAPQLVSHSTRSEHPHSSYLTCLAEQARNVSFAGHPRLFLGSHSQSRASMTSVEPNPFAHLWLELFDKLETGQLLWLRPPREDIQHSSFFSVLSTAWASALSATSRLGSSWEETFAWMAS